MEARDLVVAADHQLQRRADVVRVHAQVGGAVAVDLDAQLGLVELERGVGVDDAPDLAVWTFPREALRRNSFSGSRSGPRMTKSMSTVAAADVEARSSCALRRAGR